MTLRNHNTTADAGVHTPGPWSAYPYVQHAGQFAIEAKSENGYRIDVGQTFMVLEGDPLANARLIASAPDLLEALEALRGNIAAASFARKPAGIKLRAQADAAIAKARGANK